MPLFLHKKNKSKTLHKNHFNVLYFCNLMNNKKNKYITTHPAQNLLKFI